jgi:prevent-host-death family protein
MFVTATEFKENMGKYLALANSEDIIITKNGKQVARLTGVHNTAMLTDSLIGIIPDSSVNLTTLREERLERYESNKGSN